MVLALVSTQARNVPEAGVVIAGTSWKPVSSVLTKNFERSRSWSLSSSWAIKLLAPSATAATPINPVVMKRLRMLFPLDCLVGLTHVPIRPGVPDAGAGLPDRRRRRDAFPGACPLGARRPHPGELLQGVPGFPGTRRIGQDHAAFRQSL